MDEKDRFDDFIVGFGFGDGRVPLVASPRPSPWWPSLRLPSAPRVKMRGQLDCPLFFRALVDIEKSLNYLLARAT